MSWIRLAKPTSATASPPKAMTKLRPRKALMYGVVWCFLLLFCCSFLVLDYGGLLAMGVGDSHGCIRVLPRARKRAARAVTERKPWCAPRRHPLRERLRSRRVAARAP